ncbi:flagellar export chaperone FliS [Paralcaligenes sp. KSB-10]|uniref:flagellar export chaperone FliS n=1 Tax=Paralcaligenes sp. KSB-10 TaxID=2901142 RepID=UPI001E37F82F|nr:flagellar export chaperone FliS [Paralcaligenes sp. KSB-10]UHL65287.1 flagellar export chaperone FliS [Paralcaligenes sp. KSB-10]
MTYTMQQRGAGRMKSAQTYASIGLETEVLSASPERLITLLFDGAQAAIGKARLYLQQGNIEGRGKAISQAINIVESGLKASVDLEAGGELANNLVATYELIARKLLLANLNADAENLALAEQLLCNIGDAWRTAVDTKRPVITSL